MEMNLVPVEVPAHLKQRWQNMVNILAQVLDVPVVTINQVDSESMEVFTASSNPENPIKVGFRTALDKVYCHTVVQEGKMLEVKDALSDPRWRDSEGVKKGFLAYKGVPLLWPDGKVFGTICLLDIAENHFGPLYDQLLDEFKALVENHLTMIATMNELHDKTQRLEKALAEIKTLEGMLPICANCKKIRDDDGFWQRVEHYIQEHTQAQFTHGICPDCAHKLYPDIFPEEP